MVQPVEWARGVVTDVKAGSWPGVQLLGCAVGTRTIPALAYTALVGPLEPGCAVALNLNAWQLGLGTGGLGFVVARLDGGGGPADAPEPSAIGAAVQTGAGGPGGIPPDTGYLVKARYSPLQVVAQGVDSPGSPHHGVLAQATDLGGLPVVVADLHSSLPAICAGALAAQPGLRLAYVMTDGAALPLVFSKTVARLRASGQLCATITAGQAYGGDHEAASVHSALLAARHVARADVAVAIQGPGNLGTGTVWGFSGVAAGEAINAAAILGGRPVGCLRISGADRRPRHRGLSHHSVTAYGQVALRPADLVLPIFGPELGPELVSLGGQVVAQARWLGPPWGIHHLVKVATDGLLEVLRAVPGLNTMGRGLEDDPAAFLAAAAAGRHAAALAATG
ncbi:MAG: DUF3866 family protein [Bifidobacteriaceae bacterium]|nr:DUF3866 family protein [Bifidobacteriaceae bacterium]